MNNKFEELDKRITKEVMDTMKGKVIPHVCQDCNGKGVYSNSNNKCLNCNGQGSYLIQY